MVIMVRGTGGDPDRRLRLDTRPGNEVVPSVERYVCPFFYSISPNLLGGMVEVKVACNP